VYSALFSMSGRGHKTLMEPAAMSPEALLQRLQGLHPAPSPIIFMGNGLAPYGEFIKKNRKGALLAGEALWHVRASNIAYLAERMDRAIVTPIDLAPLYLRKSEAEIRKKST
ncbi:MAG: hypothetical protein ACE5DR_07880, partial [Thermodesulfobacteriota bacterium]